MFSILRIFFLFQASMLIWSGTVFAQAAGRITAPADPGARCMSQAFTVEFCSQLSQMAVDQGCITAEERDALIAYGSFPMCMPDRRDPSKLTLGTWCQCGCFHPDTQILSIFKKGDLSIFANFRAQDIAEKPRAFELITLHKDASIAKPDVTAKSIRISTKGPEAKPLVVIHTDTGQTLKVTTRHAILLSSGEMVQAQKLKVGDELVSRSVGVVRIKNIERETTTLNVVNFASEAKDPIEHIIVAEDLFVGDLLWQSSLEDQQNQIIVRKR